MLMEYFKYQSPSFLAKDLHKASQARNEQIVNQVNDALIDLWNAVDKKEIAENENPDKGINIVEKILDINPFKSGLF